ncbi:MAG: peptidyl-prolyl cis-trans isomerase [Brevinematales bacterium]|nr:peptidyl-prolyl cis-trans isomerase [Brevinematales bacterium]
MADKKGPGAILYIIIAFVVGLGAGFGLTKLLGGAVSGGIKTDKIMVQLNKTSDVGSDWLVKIDDYAISKSEFEDSYNLLKSTSPQFAGLSPQDEAKLKWQYFESMIDEYIVTLQAVNKGNMNIKTANLLINSSARQSIYTLYLKDNLPLESSFNPTDQEIEQFYQQYKDQFKKSGYNAEQIKQVAIENVKKLKLQQWMMSFITHIKEGYKIERNFDAMKALGITEMGMEGGMGGGAGQMLPSQGMPQQPMPK